MWGVFSNQAEGVDKLSSNKVAIRNEFRAKRRESFNKNDSQAILDIFKRLQGKNSGFFYSLQLDDENRISTIFWVDARSRAAYQNFGDVVTFDTTYRRNKYSMPFAPFTGVNHHYQSILFGSALVRDETEESFTWLFETWLEAMYHIPPKTIITDMSLVMEKAIAKVFPDTHHGLCTWHISNKYPEWFYIIYAKHPTFKSDFNTCVKKSLTIDVFEERWAKLMDDYSLHKYERLKALYEIKTQWVGAYTKKFFAAGINTTLRSKGMNAFFDGYVCHSSSIKEFVLGMQKALDKEIFLEREADAATVYRKRAIIVFSPLEAHAAQVYTEEMFRQFQEELQKSNQYIMTKLHEQCTKDLKVYALRNVTNFANPCSSSAPKNRRHFTVSVCLDTRFVNCNCQLFEHKGILCRHVLKFFSAKNVCEIPKEYILDRWTKQANRVHGHIPYVPNVTVDFEQSETLRYNHLCNIMNGLSLDAASTMDGYKYQVDAAARDKANLAQFRVAIPNTRDTPTTRTTPAARITRASVIASQPVVDRGSMQGEYEDIFDPILFQTKGRKRAIRMKSPIEDATDQKRLRMCVLCNKMTAHDKRNHYKVLGIEPDGLHKEDDNEEEC